MKIIIKLYINLFWFISFFNFSFFFFKSRYMISKWFNSCYMRYHLRSWGWNLLLKFFHVKFIWFIFNLAHLARNLGFAFNRGSDNSKLNFAQSNIPNFPIYTEFPVWEIFATVQSHFHFLEKHLSYTKHNYSSIIIK